MLQLVPELVDLLAARPITRPGRAVEMLIVTFETARSMMIREMPAWDRRFFRYLRMKMSSSSSSA